MLTISSPDVHHVSTISSSYLLHVSMVSSSCLHHIVILFSPYLYHIFYHICTVSSPQCHKLSFLPHFNISAFMNLQQNLTISFAISSPDFDLIFTLLSSYRHHIFIIYIYILALFPSYVDKIITISSPDFHYVLTISSPSLHRISSSLF